MRRCEECTASPASRLPRPPLNSQLRLPLTQLADSARGLQNYHQEHCSLLAAEFCLLDPSFLPVNSIRSIKVYMHANSDFGFCAPKQAKIMPLLESESSASKLQGMKLIKAIQDHPANSACTCLKALRVLALHTFRLACRLLRSTVHPPLAPKGLAVASKFSRQGPRSFPAVAQSS